MHRDIYHPIPSDLTTEQQGALMMRLYEEIPEHARAMFRKRKASVYLPKQKAVTAPWLQLHNNDRRWLIIDFDSNDEWHWKKLPIKPNIVCYNTANGNHQVFYLLRVPVHCQKSSQRHPAYKYLRGLEKALDAKYGGDDGFNRNISKNPLHERWDTIWIHDQSFTLKELEVGLKANEHSEKNTTTKLEGKDGRNVAVFDKVRIKAYREVERYKTLEKITYEDWESMVLEWCSRSNSFDVKAPMSDKELASIAKSIARFCWYVYTPKSKEVKPKLTPEQIKEALQKAQRMTKAKQVGKSTFAIKQAIEELQRSGKKVTKAAVAREVGLSRKTVSSPLYKHLFEVV